MLYHHDNLRIFCGKVQPNEGARIFDRTELSIIILTRPISVYLRLRIFFVAVKMLQQHFSGDTLIINRVVVIAATRSIEVSIEKCVTTRAKTD